MRPQIQLTQSIWITNDLPLTPRPQRPNHTQTIGSYMRVAEISTLDRKRTKAPENRLDDYRANGIPEPYEATARRKIVPETLEKRVLTAFRQRTAGSPPLFRKTSCAVSYVHGLPDYNGHYGIRELCDICPAAQLDLCRRHHRTPSAAQLQEAAEPLPEAAGLRVLEVSDRAAIVSGLPNEHPRYYLQHRFAFQIHDVGHPHLHRQHGRAPVGHPATDTREDQA